MKKQKFEWKKSGKLKSPSSVFSEVNFESENISIGSCASFKKHKKVISGTLEAKSFSKQLKNEGADLATVGKFDEAIEKWNKAITLTPNDEKIYEMKAQVLMLQEQDFSAVKCAELAVTCNKLWYVGWLTLGRSQMNIKDFAMAKKSFSRAVHLQPSENEIHLHDLQPAVALLKQSGSPT